MELNDIVTKNFESYADNTLHNQLEDVAKYHVAGGMPRALYLFANQMKVDKGMILRKAGYIGGEYRRQYEKQNHGLYPVISRRRSANVFIAICALYWIILQKVTHIVQTEK